MKFDVNDYKGTYYMHCKTKEESDIFLEYLNSLGRKWVDGESYLSPGIYGTRYGKHVYDCYNFNCGQISSEGIIKDLNLDNRILEFSEFDWEGYDYDDDYEISNDDIFDFIGGNYEI